MDVPGFLEVFKTQYVTAATSAGWVPADFVERCVPLATVKPKIDSLVGEFFDTGDTAEATRCLRDFGPLNAGHVHAETIRRLCAKAMEKADREQKLASALIYHWRHTDAISALSVHQGFTALLRTLSDLVHDVPCAFLLMNDFVGRATHDGLLPEGWLDEQLRAA